MKTFLIKLGTTLTLALPVCAAAEPMTVELGTREGDLYVVYRFPAGRDFVKFENGRSDKIRRERWKALSDCGVFADGGLRLARPDRCRTVRFEIIKGTLQASRTYQLAESIADESDVMIHTSHFSVDAPQVRWRFKPGPGEIVINEGRVSSRPVTVRTTGAELVRGERLSRRYNDAMVYFGKPDRLQRWGDALVVADADLPTPLKDRLAATFKEAMRDYARAFGPNPHPRALFLKYQTQADSGSTAQAGDVARDSMVRMSVTLPPEPTPTVLDDVDKVLAHELSHLWNSGQAHSTQIGDQPWLHEGGADWITYAWLRQSGRLSEAAFRQILSDRLNACRSKIGNEPFKGDGNGAQGTVAYHCGMSLYWLGYLSLRQRQPGLTPLAAMGGFFRRFPAYDDARWLAYFAAADADLKATVQGAVRFADSLPALLRTRGIEADSEPIDAREFPAIAGELIAALQGRDCQGGLAFWQNSDHFALEPMPECATFKRPLKVNSIAGIKPLQDPLAALASLRAVCQQTPTVTVGMLDGETVEAACPERISILSDRLKLREISTQNPDNSTTEK